MARPVDEPRPLRLRRYLASDARQLSLVGDEESHFWQKPAFRIRGGYDPASVVHAAAIPITDCAKIGNQDFKVEALLLLEKVLDAIDGNLSPDDPVFTLCRDDRGKFVIDGEAVHPFHSRYFAEVSRPPS